MLRYLKFSVSVVCMTMVMPLHAGTQMASVLKYINTSWQAIQKEEQEGNYEEALKLASNSYEKLHKMGLMQNAQKFSDAVKRLESKVPPKKIN